MIVNCLTSEGKLTQHTYALTKASLIRPSAGLWYNKLAFILS